MLLSSQSLILRGVWIECKDMITDVSVVVAVGTPQVSVLGVRWNLDGIQARRVGAMVMASPQCRRYGTVGPVCVISAFAFLAAWFRGSRALIRGSFNFNFVLTMYC